MFNKIHHIGYAVSNIEKSKDIFLRMGIFKIDKDIIVDIARDVKVCFLKSNDCVIELVEGISEKSPIANIIKNNGSTPYHICYEVDYIDDIKQELKEMKFVNVCKKQQAVALDNRNVIFYYSEVTGLIELVEKGELSE